MPSSHRLGRGRVILGDVSASLTADRHSEFKAANPQRLDPPYFSFQTLDCVATQSYMVSFVHIYLLWSIVSFAFAEESAFCKLEREKCIRRCKDLQMNFQCNDMGAAQSVACSCGQGAKAVSSSSGSSRAGSHTTSAAAYSPVKHGVSSYLNWCPTAHAFWQQSRAL